jgi:hypothetical protein
MRNGPWVLRLQSLAHVDEMVYKAAGARDKLGSLVHEAERGSVGYGDVHKN